MKIIERWSDSNVFRIALTIPFSLWFIIVLPIALVVSPFVLAWDLSGAITQSVRKNKQQYDSFSKMDWDKIKFSLDTWKNMGND